MSPRHPLIQGWRVTVIGDVHFVTKVCTNTYWRIMEFNDIRGPQWLMLKALIHSGESCG